MKPHVIRGLLAFGLFLLGALHQAQAAIITNTFTELGNNKWSVTLALTNDSEAAGINEFSLYFPQASYSALSVFASPANWDSFVAQSDALLGAPGFFDSYRPQALGIGDSLAGFTIGFTFLGLGAPEALAFDIIGSNFQPVFSGTSTIITAAVPEPATAWLMLAGCTLLAFKRKSRTGAAA